MKRYDIKQEYADLINDWWENHNYAIFVISGYAGTGKTSLARSIPDLLKTKSVAFLAPTGKAALLMENGRTIHSYLYHAVKDKDTGVVSFVRKTMDNFNDDLLIIDEVSMVSDELLADLKSIDTPIIGLGDSAQLPPVNGDNTLLESADIFLTEIFRSDDGIVNLATDIREGRPLKLKYDGVRFSSRKFVEDIGLVSGDSIIICKFNKTRIALNQAYRRFHIADHRFVITEGEKLIITKNNPNYGLMNGSIVTIVKIKSVKPNERTATVLIEDDTGRKYDIDIDVSLLLNLTPLSHHIYEKNSNLHTVDYAYAITCHKAQGSEFESVYIVNEGRTFSDHRAWFYTAVTRAKKEVRIYNFG